MLKPLSSMPGGIGKVNMNIKYVLTIGDALTIYGEQNILLGQLWETVH
jgi:hypothetical protein